MNAHNDSKPKSEKDAKENQLHDTGSRVEKQAGASRSYVLKKYLMSSPQKIWSLVTGKTQK